jgi:hypothetical protein
MLEDSFSFALVNSRFPHVGHLLLDHWEDPEFTTYMENLLRHDRRRKGFPREIEGALHSLAIEHDMEFPYFTHADRDF